MGPPDQTEPVRTWTATTILRALLVAAVSFGVHFFVTVVIAVFLVGVVPPYIQFFEVNDTELPTATIQIVRLSMTAVSYWYLLFVALLFIDGPILVALQFLPRSLRWLKILWFDGFLLAAIAFLIYGSIALCMPIEGMREPLGGP